MEENLYCPSCKINIYTRIDYCFACGSTHLIKVPRNPPPITEDPVQEVKVNENEKKKELIVEIKRKQQERSIFKTVAALESLAPAPHIKFKGKFKLSALDYADYQSGRISKTKLITKNVLRYIPIVGLAADTLVEGSSTVIDLMALTPEQLAEMDMEDLKEIHRQLYA